ncbi:hypothetical protein KIN20_014006 [Parelaphostrongylus tenuis]|uniref:Uncharacterized protein n=1 Tax=Parelaphostrongylus tenuis TaxID=148309 RepID=A0AAD5MCY9_PARTN|nr:hypothetical protein KIN20_014006 [Parelaphostrongylus tenuis]
MVAESHVIRGKRMRGVTAIRSDSTTPIVPGGVLVRRMEILFVHILNTIPATGIASVHAISDIQDTPVGPCSAPIPTTTHHTVRCIPT